MIRNENWGVSLQGSGVLKLNSGGTLSGTAGGAIYLGVGTKVDGMSGKFIDQGTTLTATGEVTVGAVDALISATGLSRGLYAWNGSAFVKAGTAPTITTTTLPNGTVGAAYSATLAATGDTPITWSIDSGTLPGGLTLTGSTGVISGIPAAAGTATFTVKATNGVSPDAAKSLSITVTAGSAPPPVPVFYGLADEYTAGSPAVPLQVAGTGSESLTVFKVNGTEATELNPATAGAYRVEAASADGKLRIWKYVQVK